jgi:hypothetical protein
MPGRVFSRRSCDSPERPRSRRGAPLEGRGAPRRRTLNTKDVTDRGRFRPRWSDVWVPVAGPTEVGPWAGTGRPVRDRMERPRSSRGSRPNVRDVTVGPAEAGPGVTARRSRSLERPKPDAGPGSPCLGAYADRERISTQRGLDGPRPPRGPRSAWASLTRPSTVPPEGEAGDARTMAVSIPRRGGDRASTRTEHG